MQNISVVIRSIGRESLRESLHSAFSQTYRPAEVVVVDARGDLRIPTLRMPPGVSLRVAGGRRLDRPSAANAGLDDATGDWIIFLDDDDTFLPSHIASLIECLERSPDARVAYSATLGVDMAGQALGVIDHSFDRMRLLEENFIQIGAAMFHRSLLEHGCRFDERLSSCQDWDFWIQLSTFTRFAATHRPTTRWFAEGGTSGAGTGPNCDPSRMVTFKGLVHEKWRYYRSMLRDKVAYYERRAAERASSGGAHRFVESAAALRSGVLPEGSDAWARAVTESEGTVLAGR